LEMEEVQHPDVGDPAADSSIVASHPAPPTPPVTMAAAASLRPSQASVVPRLASRVSGRYDAVTHTVGGPPFYIFWGVGAGRGGVGRS